MKEDKVKIELKVNLNQESDIKEIARHVSEYIEKELSYVNILEQDKQADEKCTSEQKYSYRIEYNGNGGFDYDEANYEEFSTEWDIAEIVELIELSLEKDGFILLNDCLAVKARDIKRIIKLS